MLLDPEKAAENWKSSDHLVEYMKWYNALCIWSDGWEAAKNMAAFVFKLHGASKTFLTSQWRNLTVGQIMVFPNYVIVTSKKLC